MPIDLWATITSSVRKKPGRTFYCPARLEYQEGKLFAEPVSSHGSGDFVAAVKANGIIIFPENSSIAETGEQVVAHLWQMPLELARSD